MTLADLLVYPAFRGLAWLTVSALFVAVGVIAAIIISHVMFSLGRRSSLYKKKQPVEGWNKRFYPAASSMIVLLIALGLWLRSQL